MCMSGWGFVSLAICRDFNSTGIFVCPQGSLCLDEIDGIENFGDAEFGSAQLRLDVEKLIQLDGPTNLLPRNATHAERDG